MLDNEMGITLPVARDRYLRVASRLARREQNLVKPLMDHSSERVRMRAKAVLPGLASAIHTAAARAHDIEVLRLMEEEPEPCELLASMKDELVCRLARSIQWGHARGCTRSPEHLPPASEEEPIDIKLIRAHLGDVCSNTVRSPSPQLITSDGQSPLLELNDSEIHEMMPELLQALQEFETERTSSAQKHRVMQLLLADPYCFGHLTNSHAPAIIQILMVARS